MSQDVVLAGQFFAGIGSGHRGLDALGMRAPVVCEIADVERETLKLNIEGLDKYPQSRFPKDIRDYSASKKDSTFISFGSFTAPCQNFTTMNNSPDLPKGTELIFETMRVIEELQPDHLLFENVRGFKGDKAIWKGMKIHRIFERFLINLGYNLMHDQRGPKHQYIFTAADYGAPQNRVRYILTASKKFTPAIPKRQKRIDFGDVLKFVNRNGNTGDVNHGDEILRRYAKLPEGKWVKQTPQKIYSTTYILPRDGKGQAPTILDQDGSDIVSFMYDERGRKISVEEIKALQTIPENHKLAGNKKEKHRGLGNVLPSSVEYAFAHQFANPNHVTTWRQYWADNLRNSLGHWFNEPKTKLVY